MSKYPDPRKPNTYPSELQPFVRILLENEERLSDGYGYYCAIRSTIIRIATEMHDVARQLPEVRALAKRLGQARDAIKSLPENALGTCGSGNDQWPLSKELLHHIANALAPFAKEPADDT